MNRLEPSAELDDYARRVLLAASTVHSALGPGLSEGIYERALVIELRKGNVLVEQQVQVPIIYDQETIGSVFIDVLVEGQLIVELKSVDVLLAVHRSQVISYLQAAQLQLGLLINFNVSYLRQGVKRVIWNGTPREHDPPTTKGFLR